MYFLPPTNLFYILADLLQAAVVLIILEVAVSWLVLMGTISSSQPWVRTLRRITNPMLEPIRGIVPPRKTGGFDLSPLLAIFVINIVQYVLVRLGRG